MIKFFRQIRFNLMGQNKTGKYLKYAIGEIVLVVIGILIALQINNWNENRKIKNKLDNIYSIIQKNLKTDITNITHTINYYEEIDINLEAVLTAKYSTSFLDSINENNYLECVICGSNINQYVTFTKMDKGLELLKKYDENIATSDDSLSQEVIEFYSTTGEYGLNTFLDLIKSEAVNNLKYFEQFPWYTDFLINKYNPEAVSYFTQNQIYKNKAATFKNVVITNYLKALRGYKDNASEILKKIERRQEEK